MEDLGAKETVIIVHGTWAAPKDNNPDQIESNPDQSGNVSWYQIPRRGQSNFVSKLNDALERRGSPARCWAHCQDNSEIFTWSGENAWIDRTGAAVALAAHINPLQADGWRCHLVAHSHGGNVVAEALPLLQRPPERPSAITGRITTLGTPFVDAMSAIYSRSERRYRFMNILAWSFAVMFVLVIDLTMLWGAYTSGDLAKAKNVIILIFVLGLYPLMVWIPFAGWRKKQRLLKKNGWVEYWSSFKNEGTVDRPFILSISTCMDEAWQLLHHIKIIPNPLAPKSGLISYLLKSRKSYIRRSSQIAQVQGLESFRELPILTRIVVVALWLLCIRLIYELGKATVEVLSGHGMTIMLYFIGVGAIVLVFMASVTYFTIFFGTKFYSAMLAPMRWIARQLRAMGRLFSVDLGTYIALRRIWPLSQEIAFGLEGYGFEIPHAKREPAFADAVPYQYEDLAKGAEQRALARRDQWLMRNFGEVTKTFSEMIVTASDLSTLLRKVETDLSLVHAAYYTDDECIERIADWIAGKAPETETGDAKLLGTAITEYGTAASHSALGH